MMQPTRQAAPPGRVPARCWSTPSCARRHPGSRGEGRARRRGGSWLNPTRHAIAVYASQPLSPEVTQHSLPSGRYSLLGPDLHRLDRTSFAWFLLDHLVGPRQHGGAVMRSIRATLESLTDEGWAKLDQTAAALSGDSHADPRRHMSLPGGQILRFCTRAHEFFALRSRGEPARIARTLACMASHVDIYPCL
jgi:hypothetical protein